MRVRSRLVMNFHAAPLSILEAIRECAISDIQYVVYDRKSFEYSFPYTKKDSSMPFYVNMRCQRHSGMAPHKRTRHSIAFFTGFQLKVTERDQCECRVAHKRTVQSTGSLHPCKAWKSMVMVQLCRNLHRVTSIPHKL